MAGAPRLIMLINESGFFLSHRANIARAARHAGWDVHLITRLQHEPSQLARHGVTVHPLNFPRTVHNPIHEWQTVRRLTELYQQIEPDVIHHFSAKAVLLGSAAAARLNARRVVNTFTGLGSLFLGHGLSDWCRRQLAIRALRHVLRDRAWIATFQNAEDLGQLCSAKIVHPSQCQLIRGSGVDPQEFLPSGSAPSKPRVMLAARMIRPKGIAEFVEAAGRVRAQEVPAEFVLVGPTDPLNPQAIPESQLQQWHSEGTVRWWGACGNMPYTLNQATIVVLPSYYGEGIPKVLLEAAACARPLIATDTRGCRDVVQHEHNGLLVPARDPAALAGAIVQLLDQPWEGRQMGAAGRKLVLRHFTTDEVDAQTLALYDSMLAPERSRAA